MRRRIPRGKAPLQIWAGQLLEQLRKELTFMQRHHKGWERAWEEIKKRYGDFDCECPETGERWQYMGTLGGFHDFRHRCLPATGERTYAKVAVESDDFVPISEPKGRIEDEFTVRVRVLD